jgi:hypothetical protein
MARSVFGRVSDNGVALLSRARGPALGDRGARDLVRVAPHGRGRVHGTFHEMQLRTAILEGRFESLGQASGDSPLWPGGSRSYAYGSLFFAHMLERHGEDRDDRLRRIGGQWIPYRLDAAGPIGVRGVAHGCVGVLGAKSFSTSYGDYDAELERAHADHRSPSGSRIGARWALHPRSSSDGATARPTPAPTGAPTSSCA